jgi:GTP-binding protein Era
MKSGIVSFIGRPNAGKSTLINRLVGRKVAIVSDKPQTTRNRILAVKHRPDGQIAFLDTPGIHRPLHRMNVRMVDAALETLREVDVLALVVDVSEPIGGGDKFVFDLVSKVETPVVAVLNKIDRISKPALLPLMQYLSETRNFAELVPVSALTGENVDRLEQVLLDRLPEGEALYPADYLTDQPERAFIAEIVREQVLGELDDELPFATAVVLDGLEEPENGGLMRIYASILVERESHKPIVIGRAGRTIKAIGTAARRELERLFGSRVYLDLHVKVRPDWREDERVLDQIGVRGDGSR